MPTTAATSRRSVFAWHGWRLHLPGRWNPIKLEGDRDDGHALFIDLHRPRLGVRWKAVAGRRFDADKWARNMLRAEVGKLAADEARPFAMPDSGWIGCLLYEEPKPPGRDVWVGYSERSGRGVQLIYHARHRDRVLASVIAPALEDLPADKPLPWSVFDLSCTSPSGFTLASHRLNAGDLSLTFQATKKQQLTVRQVALAELALKRLPMEKWLAQQELTRYKHYRTVGEPEPLELAAAGRLLSGLARPLRRRRRFFWRFDLPRAFVTCALHDKERDRLVIVQGTRPTESKDGKAGGKADGKAGGRADGEDPVLDPVEQLLESIGWAGGVVRRDEPADSE